MRFSTITTLFTAAALVAAPAVAEAQFTVYTTFADFLSATSNVGTDSFDDLDAYGSYAGPLTRQAGTHNYTVSTNLPGFYIPDNAGDRWLSTNDFAHAITFSGFGSSVRGIGGYFFGTDVDGAPYQLTGLVLTATGKSGASYQTIVDGSMSFFGVVADEEILSFTVAAQEQLNANGPFMWPTANDVVIGNAATVVPEPSSFVLMLVGAAGLAFVVQRRRTT
ncbi:hypothetical protein GAU_3288 [Gemmatimonas aurantiaca T-27]|uniref:Ice-binding protein C-terminal domain-containing protein n=2 Tax=Gemmatimonas aurantiaca TaxID=173480 RepID=C1ACV3_GEMAT|nr:PEP-CTERM sorting domain-containing protein [Gemmatimonas aurantiaca]BAH40330.1 hypothetical protein GAU_3288 [Gemmatimonas aurantiaca T-27]